MTTRRLAKGCERLERWAWERRRALDRELECDASLLRALERLFEAFPAPRRAQLAAFIESGKWPGSGLESVLNSITNSTWEAVPIPDVVAEVFLSEPEARPSADCAACRALLPYRSGIWTDTATGQSWQGPLTYFKRCPCGGEILIGGRPACWASWLPERVVPPWTFAPQ